MFGYVMINKPELKVKEYNRYHGYYCGICRCLKQKFGISGQMTLNYDMVFMAALLTGLYEGEESIEERRCLMHPTTKHLSIVNPYVDYAADMTVLLSYYNLLDDWKDEKKALSLTAAAALKRSAKTLAAKYPRQAKAVRSYMEALHRMEEERVNGAIDELAGLTGTMLGELFVMREDHWSADLKECAFYLGKYIYLLDAYEDLDKDSEKGIYNPLSEYQGRADYEEWILQVLTLTMAGCAQSFERLPIITDAELMRNILYSGVWVRYEKARKEKQEGRMNGSL